MDFDFNTFSKEFEFFHYAFAFETYGKSMGRAAQYASADFKKLSPEEQTLATEWFLELFSQPKELYGAEYFEVVEQMQDKRFIPLIKDYYKRLKKRNHKMVSIVLDGHTYTRKRIYTSELKRCKTTIRALKRQ